MRSFSQKQKGAMLVEFLVVASSVLISLFILTPYLAKITDLRHKNEQAAQYSSWQRTVHYSGNTDLNEDAIKKSAQQRVFNNANALISTEDIGAFKADSFHYFVDSKTGKPKYVTLLGARGDNNNFLSIQSKAEPDDDLTSAFTSGTKLATKTTTFQPEKNFKKDSYYKTTSNLFVKQPSWMDAFTQDTQTMTTQKTILVDGWGVKGKDKNKSIVNTLQPIIFNQEGDFDLKKGLKIYVEVYNVLADALKIITIDSLDIDDDLDELDFDHVDTDLLLTPDGYKNDKGKTIGEQLGTY